MREAEFRARAVAIEPGTAVRTVSEYESRGILAKKIGERAPQKGTSRNEAGAIMRKNKTIRARSLVDR